MTRRRDNVIRDSVIYERIGGRHKRIGGRHERIGGRRTHACIRARFIVERVNIR